MRNYAKNSKLRLCASHGLLAPEAFFRLKDAGVTMYHANIETSPPQLSKYLYHSYI